MPPVLGTRLQAADATNGGSMGPPPGAIEEIGLRAKVIEDEDPEAVRYRRYQAYEPLIEALRDKGVSDDAMRSRAELLGFGIPGSDGWDFDKIYTLATQYKLGDLRKDRADFEAWHTGRQGAYRQNMRRAEQGGRWWAELPLGIVQSFRPEYGPLPALGLPSKTILGAAAREAAINTLFEGAEIARAQDAREVLGNPITGREVVTRLGLAAGGGAGFGVLGKVVPKGWSAGRGRLEELIANNWEKLPEGLRTKWGAAAKVDDRALPDVVEALIGRDNLSADEKGALALLRRENEIDAANPFRPDGAGQAAHQAAVIRNIERVTAEIDGMSQPRPNGGETALSSGTVRVPGRPGQVGYANDVYQFFRSKGLSDAQARGIAAGIHAESGSDHGIRGGHKGRALGLGQWLGPRRAKLIARYGENPTRAQQLEYLWEELNGGDAGGRAVLSAGDEVGVLDAYIRKFMRPAPGAETVGDLTRGMQALGRGGEDLTISERAGGEADPEAAISADLTARRQAIDAERAALDETPPARGDELEPEAARLADAEAPGEVVSMPELRREDFPDETSWRIAQAAVDAEALGVDGALARIDDIADLLGERLPPDVPAWMRSAVEQAPVAARSSILRDLLAEWERGRPAREAFDRAADALPAELRGIDARPLMEGERFLGIYSFRRANGDVMHYRPRDGMIGRVKSRSKDIVWRKISPQNLSKMVGAAQRQLAEDLENMAPPRRTTDVPGNEARDGSPARGAGGDIAERAAEGNAAASSIGTGARDEALPFDALWSDDGAPRDAGGLTANERASVDYEEPGLATYSDPEGAGAKLDLDEGRHDLQAEIDSDAALDKVTFAAVDGADETIGDVLKDIDGEEAALKALRDCL